LGAILFGTNTLRPLDGCFVPHNLMSSQGTPVPLSKFQMALRIRLNIWVQEEGTQKCMSEWSQSFSLTQNVCWGFFLCSTSPT